ncbi:MAG: 2-C-methyl-D-erythritol 2,4-cyclodiphosphate synthase [Candidatus Gygaella obscura]|nr:2-C-methyl-D-erythritol 2,4-cyclodiphosphate synthase [Candidatus Gygaella obscura]
MRYKVGYGYDLHRLIKGKKFILGGVKIDSSFGMKAHSDGDVLLHAVSDAILGAVGSGDIGELFPDTKKENKDLKSELILKKADSIMRKKGFSICNIDSVLLLEKPKLSKYKQKIIANMARILKINKSKINLKAKTQEGFGAIGSKRAIAAFSVVLVERK